MGENMSISEIVIPLVTFALGVAATSLANRRADEKERRKLLAEFVQLIHDHQSYMDLIFDRVFRSEKRQIIFPDTDRLQNPWAKILAFQLVHFPHLSEAISKLHDRSARIVQLLDNGLEDQEFVLDGNAYYKKYYKPYLKAQEEILFSCAWERYMYDHRPAPFTFRWVRGRILNVFRRWPTPGEVLAKR